MYSYRRKRDPEPRQSVKGLEREIRGRLANAAGGPLFGDSPIGSVRGYFRQTFDRAGMARTPESNDEAEMAEETETEMWEPRTQTPRQAETGREPRGPKERAAGGPGLSVGLPTGPVPLERFSEFAFRRGNLAGSILQGTGKMMLVSCLRRSLNPRRPEPHPVFDPCEKRLPFSGSDPDSLIHTRDFARGAVSIVVDTLHDARRSVDNLAEAVEKGGPGAQELFAMYPFLDDSREKSMAAEYRQALAATEDPGERGLLQNAAVHAEAMVQAKDRARLDFLTALRQISDQAQAAIEEFSTPEFAESAAMEALEPEEPPEDGGERDLFPESGYGEDGDLFPESEYGEVPGEDADGAQWSEQEPGDGDPPYSDATDGSWLAD